MNMNKIIFEYNLNQSVFFESALMNSDRLHIVGFIL